jgi:adenylate kinase family enzyme
VPWVELDAIFHQAGWVPLDEEEFKATVTAAAAGDGWVIEGNYSAVRPVVWRRADTVVWLDLPRHSVMRQVIVRTIKRAVTGAELWNGNKEDWRDLFSLKPEKSMIAWAWTKHAKYRAQYSAAQQDPAYAHLDFIQVTSRAQAQRLVAAAAAAATAAS